MAALALGAWLSSLNRPCPVQFSAEFDCVGNCNLSGTDARNIAMSSSGTESESEPSPQELSRAGSWLDQVVDAPQVAEAEIMPNEPALVDISEGLTTEESDDLEHHQSIDDDQAGSVSYDLVVIPGVYGTWNDDGWHGPGSGMSRWVGESLNNFSSGSRILWFKYPSYHLFSGRKSREAIRNCSLRLLRGLMRLRRNQSRVCLSFLTLVSAH